MTSLMVTDMIIIYYLNYRLYSSEIYDNLKMDHKTSVKINNNYLILKHYHIVSKYGENCFYE